MPACAHKEAGVLLPWQHKEFMVQYLQGEADFSPPVVALFWARLAAHALSTRTAERAMLLRSSIRPLYRLPDGGGVRVRNPDFTHPDPHRGFLVSIISGLAQAAHA